MEHPAPSHESAPPAHTHGQADHAHVAAHMKMYVGVGLIECVMTGLVVWLSLQDFGSTGLTIFLVLIASALNAGVVAAFLMHLKEERATIWRFLFFTAAFFVILFFLTLLYWSSPIIGTSHTHH